MSYYLNPQHAVERLREEWDKYGGIIIAVDYDSTLVPYRIHEENAPFEMIRQLIRDCKSLGCTIIINTGAEPERWEGIKADLAEINVPWDFFSETPPWISQIGRHGKVYANAYLDDRAGLHEVYMALQLIVLEKKFGNSFRAAESLSRYMQKM